MKYICSKCNKVFKQKNDLRRHKNRKRPCTRKSTKKIFVNAPKFPCPNCDKKYTTCYNLKRHLSGSCKATKPMVVLENRFKEFSKDNSKGVLKQDEYIHKRLHQNTTSSLQRGASSEERGASSLQRGGIYRCQYCKKELSKKNKARHLIHCKNKKDYDITILQEENTKLEQAIKELQEEYMDFMRTIAKEGVGSKIIYNDKKKSVNMFYIMQNFKNPRSLESLLEPELTDEEIKYIRDAGPALGSLKLLKNRCINNLPIEKRPMHCVDKSRKKFMVFFLHKWESDNGDGLIKRIINKVKPVFDIDINRDDDLKITYNKVDIIGEFLDMQKKGDNWFINELQKFTLLKNHITT
jgi:hypothetical protein